MTVKKVKYTIKDPGVVHRSSKDILSSEKVQQHIKKMIQKGK